MDIRTKLVFALVAVSLVSMLALGMTAYTQARDRLLDNNRDQLEGLAESKAEDLENVLEGWDAQVRLISSRTRLRDLLAEYAESQGPPPRAAMRRILNDAQNASETLQRLTLYDLAGRPLASTLTARSDTLPPLDLQGLPRAEQHTRLRGIAVVGDTERYTQLNAIYTAWLYDAEQERIGALEVILDARPALDDLLENYTGLRKTGETLVALRDTAGTERILHSGRHGVPAEALIITTAREDLPAARALRGEESTFTEAIVDYRGEPVWAATRFMRDPGWGVVVKFDAKEEREDVVALRGEMLELGLSLSALAILVGILLGLWFARPIHELAEVADRIRHGDLDARAKIRTEDEVGALARTFNEMAEELIRAQRELQQRIGRGAAAPSEPSLGLAQTPPEPDGGGSASEPA